MKTHIASDKHYQKTMCGLNIRHNHHYYVNSIRSSFHQLHADRLPCKACWKILKGIANNTGCLDPIRVDAMKAIKRSETEIKNVNDGKEI